MNLQDIIKLSNQNYQKEAEEFDKLFPKRSFHGKQNILTAAFNWFAHCVDKHENYGFDEEEENGYTDFKDTF